MGNIRMIFFFNLDKFFKDSFSSGGHFVHGLETVCAVCEEGISMNISVNLFQI